LLIATNALREEKGGGRLGGEHWGKEKNEKGRGGKWREGKGVKGRAGEGKGRRAGKEKGKGGE